MSLSSTLPDRVGVYFGTGDGAESGPFVSRIEICRLPNGGVSLSYEATSREQGVLHREHSILCAGPDGRDRLFVAHSESPFVTEMIEFEAETGRFVQPSPGEPYIAAIRSPCSGLVGRPVAGPPRCTSTITAGSPP